MISKGKFFKKIQMFFTISKHCKQCKNNDVHFEADNPREGFEFKPEERNYERNKELTEKCGTN
jgi:hypothetical protein